MVPFLAENLHLDQLMDKYHISSLSFFTSSGSLFCPFFFLTFHFSLSLLLFLLVSGTTHHGGYVHDSIVYALKECGYRHIDTAKRYGKNDSKVY